MTDQLLQRISYLVEQYSHGRCSEAERMELLTLFDLPANENAIKDLIRLQLEKLEEDESLIGHFLSAEQASGIMQKIINTPAVVVPFRKKHTWIRYAVAAAAIVIIAVSVWFFYPGSHKKPTAIAENNMPAEIAPGHDGAILKLANGQEIVLDNSNNGVLAHQGSTAIVKKNGEVVYNTGVTPGEIMYNTMTTPKGRQYNLVLADGSKVWLNAASSITFPTSFTGNERNVSITGEAYFEVAHDPSKPFHVAVNNVNVEVLGTHFNINSYDDEQMVRTTLLEGSVKVTSAAAHESSVITPGQQAQWASSTGLQVVNDVNLDEVMGWRNGYFYFEKADVKTVMRQLARWYDIDVQYRNDIPKEMFGGKIQRDLNLASVMEILETIGVRYKLQGHTLTVGSEQ